MRGADPQGQHRHAAGAFVSQCKVVQGKCEADPNGRAQDRCRAHRQSTGRERGGSQRPSTGKRQGPEADRKTKADPRSRAQGQERGRRPRQSTGQPLT